MSGSLSNFRGQYPDMFVADEKGKHECDLKDFQAKAVQCLQLLSTFCKLPSEVVMYDHVKGHNVCPFSFGH